VCLVIQGEIWFALAIVVRMTVIALGPILAEPAQHAVVRV